MIPEVNLPAQASVGRRVSAYVADGLILSVLGGLLPALLLAVLLQSRIAAQPALLLLLYVPSLLVSFLVIVIHGRTGATPGKALLGLRTLDVETRRPIGFGRALLRQLVLGLAGPLNLFQLISIPRHPRRQGWHDVIARSAVFLVRDLPAPWEPAGAPNLPTPRSDRGPRPPAPPPTSRLDLASRPSADAAQQALPPQPPKHQRADPPTEPPAGPPVEPPASNLQPVPPPPGVLQHIRKDGHADAAPGSGLLVGPPPGVVSSPTLVPPSAPPVSSGPATKVAWRLVTPSGETRSLDGPTLTGRDPDATLVPDGRAWALDDPALSVSKTHALFGVDETAPWVEDWHSTNGVALHRAGAEETLAPHGRTRLAAGDVVLLGDYPLRIVKDHR